MLFKKGDYIDRSFMGWTHWAISPSSQCSTTGVTKAVVCYPVCGIMHIKEPLLLIRKNSPYGGSGFPLSLSECSFTICVLLPSEMLCSPGICITGSISNYSIMTWPWPVINTLSGVVPCPWNGGGLSEVPCHSLLSCPCLQSPSGLHWADLHLCITALPSVMRSVWITADVALYTLPTERSTCTENAMIHVLLWGLLSFFLYPPPPPHI